nr:uncharacterized protein LOC105317280 isoform X13 [Crassostrea gigas]
MESVSSMKSLGAMNFYEEDCGVPAYMAVRNSVTKSELGKEHLELESNQLEDHINDIHDCQQDPDNFEVNGVCIDKEEEEEEDEGNASKVDEGGTTVCGIADVRNDEDGEITAKTGVHVQTQQTSVDVKCAKQDGGNSSKSMTKIWSDIPSNEDRDGIAKIEGVPEQAQGTTGSGVPGGVIRISNLKKGKGIAYVQNDEDGKTAAKTGVDVQTQATSDDVRLAKIDRGNSSKINEESMTKTWGDIPSNEDRNGIAKIEGVPEQTQGTTGPVCNDIPQKQQDAHINGLTSSNNTRNRKESVNAKQAGEEVEKEGGITTKMEEDLNTRTEYDNKDAVNTPEMDSTTENRKEEGQNGGNIPTVNAKQAGEEVEKGGGNTPKMEDDFKTRTECEDSDDVNTPKVDGATENSKEERQDEMNCLDVNDKQAGEEVEKGGGITPKMEEDLKTRNDAVNTPEMDSTTEDSKEEGQNGGNIPTVHHYSKQVGEEEEQGGGNTPKIDQDFKTSIDHYGECDSEQDAKNSPSCLKGTKNWRCSQRFYQKLLLGFFVLLAFAIHEANALPTKQSEYAADFRNTQKYLLCDYYRTPFFNTTSKTRCKSRCYNEAKENNCQPGFQGVCLPWVTGKGVIAGCIDTTGLHLDGKKCLLVTYVEGHNKYKAECHDEKCPNCTNANSLEERMKMCLFQNETSGDSQSIECSPENSSTRSGCVQPTCWIPGLAVVLLIVHVLASH